MLRVVAEWGAEALTEQQPEGNYHILKFHVGLLHGKKKYGGGVGEQRAKPGASEHRSSVLLLACCFLFVAWNAPFFSGKLLGASGQPLESVWQPSGKPLGSLEASGKPLWKLLGSLWEPLGSFWKLLGSLWEAFGKLLEASGNPLGSF